MIIMYIPTDLFSVSEEYIKQVDIKIHSMIK